MRIGGIKRKKTEERKKRQTTKEHTRTHARTHDARTHALTHGQTDKQQHQHQNQTTRLVVEVARVQVTDALRGLGDVFADDVPARAERSVRGTRAACARSRPRKKHEGEDEQSVGEEALAVLIAAK